LPSPLLGEINPVDVKGKRFSTRSGGLSANHAVCSADLVQLPDKGRKLGLVDVEPEFERIPKDWIIAQLTLHLHVPSAVADQIQPSSVSRLAVPDNCLVRGKVLRTFDPDFPELRHDAGLGRKCRRCCETPDEADQFVQARFRNLTDLGLDQLPFRHRASSCFRDKSLDCDCTPSRTEPLSRLCREHATNHGAPPQKR
jgi:hypothetical protein